MLKRLARIIQQTEAKNCSIIYLEDLLKTADGRRLYHYLEEKLAEAGLFIYDHTPDLSEERPVGNPGLFTGPSDCILDEHRGRYREETLCALRDVLSFGTNRILSGKRRPSRATHPYGGPDLKWRQ